MLNREVFANDPTTFRIPNNGVARVGVPASAQEWDTLRWELQSFVCEGEYRSGLDRILSTYLAMPPHWPTGLPLCDRLCAASSGLMTIPPVPPS